MQSDWSRAFSIATQELDFSQPSSFHRFPKATMVYHLKLKNHIDGAIFFFKISIANLFQSTLGMPEESQRKVHDQPKTSMKT